MLLCALMLSAAESRAQDVPLSRLLVDLIQSDIRLAPPPAGFQSHEAHFVPGADQQLAPYFFNQQLLTQLAIVPSGSPSGGFSFTFDPAAGTFQRATESFGPVFAERALTNGRGRLTVGANYQYSKYSSFEGESLDDGSIKFYLRHQASTGLFFEGDVIETALNLDLSSATTSVFANYGLTDALDVSVTVPFVQVSMDARVDARVLRLATGEDSTLHAFPNGTTTNTYTSSNSAAGIGDILLRAKYRFFSGQGGGVAAGFDVRLPTGDADNLLGTGATAVNALVIGSSTYGVWSPHFNLAYSASGTGDVVDVPDEFGFRLGTEFAASPRATLVADLIGRALIDAGRLKLDDTISTFTDAAGVPRATILREFVSYQEETLTLVQLGVGGKFNVTGNFLINANVLFALSSTGVSAPITPVIGFDYSF
jgi:hypothetical protein